MSEEHKVGMLLDVDNFYGEAEGRLGPTIQCILLGAAPLLGWVYLSMPLPKLFFPLWILWAFRVGLVTLGREGERLTQFRKQLNDEYASLQDLVNIKTIHDDGCIEYLNGTVAYAMLATNGTTYDATLRAQYIREFLALLGDNHDVDVYIQNITDVSSLEDRYSNVKLFVDAAAARDFIDIIDHNRSVVHTQSLLSRTIFVVKGRKEGWGEIRDNCAMAMYSASAKAFKSVKLATVADIQDIMNTDIRGVVELDTLLQQKYVTHQYYGSRVVGFDESDSHPVKEPEIVDLEGGFSVVDG